MVDLGNPHTPVAGQVTLNPGGSVSVPASATTEPPITLTVGQTYEIDVFHCSARSPGRWGVGPFNWTYDTNPGPTPRPVSQDLTAVGAVSKNWLRVYMTFTGTPVLYQWQQLYDCVPGGVTLRRTTWPALQWH